MKMSALGFLCWIQGDDDRAEEVLVEAVERVEKAGFLLAQASCHLYLALVAWRRNPGDLAAMQAHLTRSLELYSSVDDAVGLGICTLMTGIVDRLQGEPARALERFEKSQIYFAVQEFEWGITSAIYYAGDATLELATKEPGKFPESLRLLGDALQGYSDHGDWWGMGGVIGGIATAATHLGDQELAARLFGLSTALVGIVGAYLPPANLEFYRAVALHLSTPMGEERFRSAYLAGVAIESIDALNVGQQALASLRLRLAQLAPKPKPLPRLTAKQKQMVQKLVDGNPPKRIIELNDRGSSSVYQMLNRICEKWGITTWEEIAPLAIARGYATPAPRNDRPARQGWSQ